MKKLLIMLALAASALLYKVNCHPVHQETPHYLGCAASCEYIIV